MMRVRQWIPVLVVTLMLIDAWLHQTAAMPPMPADTTGALAPSARP
jgi:hypothetical protein